MTVIKRILVSVVCLLGLTSAVNAQRVEFDATRLSGSIWRYDYKIFNSGPMEIDELTLFFEPSSFESLALVSTPAGWDTLVVQPDRLLPSSGFVDVLTLSSGLNSGSQLTGLAVTFNHLNSGPPGSQLFQVVNPDTFEVLFAGTTIPAAPIPEPPTYALFLIGAVIGASFIRHRRSSRESRTYPML